MPTHSCFGLRYYSDLALLKSNWEARTRAHFALPCLPAAVDVAVSAGLVVVAVVVVVVVIVVAVVVIVVVVVVWSRTEWHAP